MILKIFLLLTLSHLATSKTIPLPNGILPEGITRGPSKKLFIGSITTGSILRLDTRTSNVDVLIPPSETTGRAAVGMVYHRGLLYVAGAFSGFPITESGNGTFYVYNVTSRTTVVRCVIPNARFINDVIVKNDVAYFTDSRSRNLVAVPVSTVRSCTHSFIALPSSFIPRSTSDTRANGIATYKDRLLVANYNRGTIYSYDLRGRHGPRRLLPYDSVHGPDGLVTDGDKLYVVENAIGRYRVSVWKMSIRDRKVRLGKDSNIRRRGFQTPTTAAIMDDTLYVVNARFNEANLTNVSVEPFWVTTVGI